MNFVVRVQTATTSIIVYNGNDPVIALRFYQMLGGVNGGGVYYTPMGGQRTQIQGATLDILA